MNFRLFFSSLTIIASVFHFSPLCAMDLAESNYPRKGAKRSHEKRENSNDKSDNLPRFDDLLDPSEEAASVIPMLSDDDYERISRPAFTSQPSVGSSLGSGASSLGLSSLNWDQSNLLSTPENFYDNLAQADAQPSTLAQHDSLPVFDALEGDHAVASPFIVPQQPGVSSILSGPSSLKLMIPSRKHGDRSHPPSIASSKGKTPVILPVLDDDYERLQAGIQSSEQNVSSTRPAFTSQPSVGSSLGSGASSLGLSSLNWDQSNLLSTPENFYDNLVQVDAQPSTLAQHDSPAVFDALEDDYAASSSRFAAPSIGRDDNNSSHSRSGVKRLPEDREVSNVEFKRVALNLPSKPTQPIISPKLNGKEAMHKLRNDWALSLAEENKKNRMFIFAKTLDLLSDCIDEIQSVKKEDIDKLTKNISGSKEFYHVKKQFLLSSTPPSLDDRSTLKLWFSLAMLSRVSLEKASCLMEELGIDFTDIGLDYLQTCPFVLIQKDTELIYKVFSFILAKERGRVNKEILLFVYELARRGTYNKKILDAADVYYHKSREKEGKVKYEYEYLANFFYDAVFLDKLFDEKHLNRYKNAAFCCKGVAEWFEENETEKDTSKKWKKASRYLEAVYTLDKDLKNCDALDCSKMITILEKITDYKQITDIATIFESKVNHENKSNEHIMGTYNDISNAYEKIGNKAESDKYSSIFMDLIDTKDEDDAATSSQTDSKMNKKKPGRKGPPGRVKSKKVLLKRR